MNRRQTCVNFERNRDIGADGIYWQCRYLKSCYIEKLTSRHVVLPGKFEVRNQSPDSRLQRNVYRMPFLPVAAELELSFSHHQRRNHMVGIEKLLYTLGQLHHLYAQVEKLYTPKLSHHYHLASLSSSSSPPSSTISATPPPHHYLTPSCRQFNPPRVAHSSAPWHQPKIPRKVRSPYSSSQVAGDKIPILSRWKRATYILTPLGTIITIIIRLATVLIISGFGTRNRNSDSSLIITSRRRPPMTIRTQSFSHIFQGETVCNDQIAAVHTASWCGSMKTQYRYSCEWGGIKF